MSDSSTAHSEAKSLPKGNWLSNFFIWLSGASADGLQQCPQWEQRKYVAFGAAVLVPCLFAIIACSYAISTLTPDWRIIVPISIIWAFIILSIDRALLATYRSFQPTSKKATQFALRIVVALLMGLTVSHPLTLLLFKDTIVATIEEKRDAEIEAFRQTSRANKTVLETKIATVEAEIANQRANWKDTFDAQFIVEDKVAAADVPVIGITAEARTEMDEQIAAESGVLLTQLAQIDEQITTHSTEYQTLQEELDHWQREFENEINGQRSGIVGVGPRARSIRDDQLEWRRAEAKRLSGLMQSLTLQRNQAQQSIASAQERIKREFNSAAASRVAKIEEERRRVANLRSQVQEQQADIFVGQQSGVRDQIQAHIDSGLAELERLRAELINFSAEEKTRVDAMRAEPRRDLLTQTLALHGLFENGEEGGHFALMAYMVLAGLFMLIDTIPLVVKFFSKPGPYDEIVAYDEYHYSQARHGVEGPIRRMSDEVKESQFQRASFRPDTALMTAFHEGIFSQPAAAQPAEQAAPDGLAAEHNQAPDSLLAEANRDFGISDEEFQPLEKRGMGELFDLNGHANGSAKNGSHVESHLVMAPNGTPRV